MSLQLKVGHYYSDSNGEIFYIKSYTEVISWLTDARYPYTGVSIMNDNIRTYTESGQFSTDSLNSQYNLIEKVSSNLPEIKEIVYKNFIKDVWFDDKAELSSMWDKYDMDY